MGIAAEVLAQQLYHYGHGRALWTPEPADGDVYIGDVGYVDEDGAFQRLFNVTVDADHPLNRAGVPENFVPLRFNKRLLQLKPSYISPMPFCSKSVKSHKLDGHAGAQVGPAGAKLAYSYECTSSQGGLLVIRDHADKTIVQPATDIVQYIRQNHDAWFGFATKPGTYGLMCKPEDIIMVRGTVKTSAWTVAAFQEAGTHVNDIELSAQAGSIADVGLQGSSSVSVYNSIEHRTGPQRPSASRPASLKPVTSGTPSQHGKYDLPELEVAAEMSKETEPENKRNQTVFLGCYKVKRRFLLPKKIVAGAGPDELPPGEDPAHPPAVAAADELAVEIDQPVSGIHVALDDVLEYILRFSDADVAIASDGDLSDLFGDCPLPDDMHAWLMDVMPTIDVDVNKTGMLSNLESIRRAHAAVQKDQEVAAQADWEVRHAALVAMQQEAEEHAAAERIAREVEQQQQQQQEFQQGSSGLSAEDRAEAVPQGTALQVGVQQVENAASAEQQGASTPMDVEGPASVAETAEAAAENRVATAEGASPAPPSPPPPTDQHRGLLIPDIPEERLTGTCIIAESKILVESPYGGKRITDFPHVVLNDPSADTGSVTSVSVTKNDRFIATGCEDCAVRIYDLSLGTLTSKLEQHQDTVWAVAFSPDGSRLVSGGADQKAFLWNMHTRELIAEMAGHTGDVWLLAYSPDGTIIATGSVDTTVRLWDAREGHWLGTLEGHNAVVMCLAFSPDGTQLASCSDSTGILWNVAQRRRIARLGGHGSVLWTLAWSADGMRLVSGAEDQSSRVWDAESGQELVTINEHTGPVWSAVFSPDGADVASGSFDASVVICDSWTGERRHLLERDPASIVNIVAYSKAGDLLVCGHADGRVRVWDPVENALVAEFQGHEDKVKTVEFMSDDQRIVTSSDDGTVRIWSMVDALRL